MVKIIDPGPPTRWSDDEMGVMAALTDEVLDDAVAEWRRVAPPSLRNLLDCDLTHSTEAAPDVD